MRESWDTRQGTGNWEPTVKRRRRSEWSAIGRAWQFETTGTVATSKTSQFLLHLVDKFAAILNVNALIEALGWDLMSKRRGRGGGGDSGFQVKGLIEWGQKRKPKKIPCSSNKTQTTLDQNLTPKKSHAEFSSHKNFQKALNDITPKKSLLKSSDLKKYLPKFPYPKEYRNRKFQPPENPSIIHVTWNPEYPPPRPRCKRIITFSLRWRNLW